MAISRRDFLNGTAISIAAGFLPSRLLAADAPYPPALTGNDSAAYPAGAAAAYPVWGSAYATVDGAGCE